jgi:hypothetical protein
MRPYCQCYTHTVQFTSVLFNWTHHPENAPISQPFSSAKTFCLELSVRFKGMVPKRMIDLLSAPDTVLNVDWLYEKCARYRTGGSVWDPLITSRENRTATTDERRTYTSFVPVFLYGCYRHRLRTKWPVLVSRIFNIE